MKELLEQIKGLAAEMRKAFPGLYSVTVNARERETELVLHNAPDYVTGTEIMRQCGVGERAKQVFTTDGRPWSTLEGDSAFGVKVQVFVSGLPPTCRPEKVTERIPKTATVDTGEYIEVERTQIVCGDEA